MQAWGQQLFCRRRLRHSYFPLTFAIFLGASIFIEHLRWLLLQKTFAKFFRIFWSVISDKQNDWMGITGLIRKFLGSFNFQKITDQIFLIFHLWRTRPNLLTLTNVRRRDVVVITTAQLHSTKSELRFCAGSNPARGVSEISDGEDLWQCSWLEIRLNTFRQSTIPQKQFIIFIIIIITLFTSLVQSLIQGMADSPTVI